jgi:hypothetical protein
MTWQNGYEAALDDVAREAQLIIADDKIPVTEVWKFIRTLAYGEPPTAAEGTSDPIEAGWRPTRNGNYRKVVSGHALVIFKNPTMDGKSVRWGYGIDGHYQDEVKWTDWQGAADEATHELERQIAEAVG